MKRTAANVGASVTLCLGGYVAGIIMIMGASVEDAVLTAFAPLLPPAIVIVLSVWLMYEEYTDVASKGVSFIIGYTAGVFYQFQSGIILAIVLCVALDIVIAVRSQLE